MELKDKGAKEITLSSIIRGKHTLVKLLDEFEQLIREFNNLQIEEKKK